MSKRHLKHKYLLQKAKFVNSSLAKSSIGDEDFFDVIVSFCTVVEKLLKIKLYSKNPVLAYLSDNGKQFNDPDSVIAISLKRDVDINSAKMVDTLKIYKKVFPKSIRDEEIELIISIYKLRNHLMHSQKEDKHFIFEESDVIKKMTIVWENRIQKIAVAFFGKNNIKQTKNSKKYSEQELQEILKEEVRKLISNHRQNGSLLISNYVHSVTDRVDPGALTSVVKDVSADVLNGYAISKTLFRGEFCPRCKNSSFKHEMNQPLTIFELNYTPELWKCSICGLELTEKQYEIAKKL